MGLGRGHYIRGVPFIAQKKNYCGPAALAMALNFYGQAADQDEIAREIFSFPLRATLIYDLEKYAREKGFKTRTYKGDLEGLKRHLDLDHPTIILVDQGRGPFQVLHYLLAIGYDESHQVVIAHSADRENEVIPYADLLKSWEKMGFLTLFLSPGNHKPSS